MLRLEQLSVGYAGARGAVLSDLQCTAQRGEFLCVLGRNGAGKSTLMRTLAGLQPALAGVVRLEGEDIARMPAAERARRISVVLTERQSSPGLTVEDVVSLGRMPHTGWQGVLSRADRQVVSDSLALVDATRFAHRLFDDLSDGERQRVLIARAFAQSPKVMVLDEITAFLDLPGRVEIMALLKRRARDSGMIVLLSSHDLDLSLQLADTVWLLDGRGALRVDAPDALAHAGWIGDAFDTDSISFSATLQRFELRSTGR